MDSPETRMSPDIFQYDNANRLLDILFQPHSPLENTNIVVDRFEDYEALSEEFEYKIDLLSDTAYWKLGDVVGLAVGLQIRQADGQKRPICGFVSTCESLGSDGGHAKYRITVVPFPTLLGETLQTRDFADKTSVEIAHTVFERHTQRNGQARSYFWVVDKTTKKSPMRSLCRQYWESDRAFFRRITREDGISYRYTHSVEDEVPIHTRYLGQRGQGDHQESAMAGLCPESTERHSRHQQCTGQSGVREGHLLCRPIVGRYRCRHQMEQDCRPLQEGADAGEHQRQNH
jgi:uncharacterized protein involved in type VI secretion and phage assembly